MLLQNISTESQMLFLFAATRFSYRENSGVATKILTYILELEVLPSNFGSVSEYSEVGHIFPRSPPGI